MTSLSASKWFMPLILTFYSIFLRVLYYPKNKQSHSLQYNGRYNLPIRFCNIEILIENNPMSYNQQNFSVF